jgi:hypothetical protein
VAEDLPVVSADIRSASTAAAEAFAELQGLVDASSPGVRQFTTERLADRSRGWHRKPARSSPISGS